MSTRMAESQGLTTPARLSALFSEKFGGQPEVIASAPGRVNIIGEHTDYNGGQVLPIAIDRRTQIAVPRGSEARKSRVFSTSKARIGEFDARAPRRDGAWGDYVSGVCAKLSAEKINVPQFDARAPRRDGAWWDYVSGVCAKLSAEKINVPQFDAVIASNIPSGAGLSSSAALEVATSLALAALAPGGDHGALPLKELALVSWRAETQFVGVNSGVMDQFASALCEPSSALHLWCDTLRTESVPMKEHVLIFDTATARSLRSSEFN